MDFELIAASGLAGWLDASWWWSIIQTVLGIGLIIFVHELGHFLAAKSCGVQCDKFYVGFDAFDLNLGVLKIPRKLFHFQWGETEYGLGILPLGGYVKMLGQHDNPTEAEAERARAHAEGGTLDPRSYMAKSVIQRMFIISAGVIMNLIFAVIFATIAFSNTVDYDPPVIGTTIAGSPAWKHDLAGAKIMKFDGHDTQGGYYSFMHLMEAVATSGADANLSIEVQRNGEEGQTEKITVQPFVNKDIGLPMLGIMPSQSCRLLKEDFLVKGQAAENAQFEGGDVITHVNGQPVFNLLDMRKELAKAPDKDAIITVSRGTPAHVQSAADAAVSEGTKVDVTVGTNPLRFFEGAIMQYGEIVAVQEGSPAYVEGVKANDKLLLVNGQKFDPMLLSAQMNLAARNNEKVKLTLRRFEGEEEVEKVITVAPRVSHNASAEIRDQPMAVDELGIAFSVLSIVSEVAEGSMAQKAGLLPNDEIVSAAIDFDDDEEKKLIGENRLSKMRLEGDELKQNWAELVSGALSYQSGYLKVKVKRGENQWDFVLKPVESELYFQPTRGIRTEPLKAEYTANSLGGAFTDGLNQVYFDGTKIFKILRQLGTGRVPLTALGGIGTIAMTAQMEASHGTSRLLLFLTLLSVNLAVLNFLPIPVLDGGHMVFLAYEGITGRPPNERVQESLTMVGAIMLLSLMVFAFGMDIWRFLKIM